MRTGRCALHSTSLIRSYNATSILQTLYREGTATRSRLAKVTRMSASTVTRIVSQLLGQGLIIEEGIGKSDGGRRPVYLRLNHGKLYTLGALMHRHRSMVAITDLKGNILDRRVFSPYSLEPPALIGQIARELRDLLQERGVQEGQLVGLGLAISGIVDSDRGVLVRSVNLGWRNVAVREELEQLIGLPVIVENDANAAALAEMWFGRAKDAPGFLFIKAGAGVGAGVVYDRRLLTGPRGMAGEIGHVPLVDGGRPCRCGQSGCLEAYLYVPDVARRYEQATGTTLPDERAFFDRFRVGDATARSLVEEAARALAVSVSHAGVLLDLDLIVIGGPWGELGQPFLAGIERFCHEVLDRSGLNKAIVVAGSQLGENSDLMGAVGLVINSWLTPPI